MAPMANAYEAYMRSINRMPVERPPSKYKQKLDKIKLLIKEYVHENAALLDELKEVQIDTIIRKEERKYLLRKLCEFEPQTALEVQNVAKVGTGTNSSNSVPHPVEHKKSKKKYPDATGNNHQQSESLSNDTTDIYRKSLKCRKSSSKSRKKVVQPIPLDSLGRPLFPIELNNLTIHSLGDVVTDKPEFHTENVIYPVGFVSTRIYGSLKDPTVKCMYTCKISDCGSGPRFEIASEENSPPIRGDTPDVCHSILLQCINDALAFNAVSTRPRGNDFFGLTHPTVLNLIQSSPGTRKCVNYKWSRFEVSKHGDHYVEDNDSGLSYQYLQRSINLCKYKMAPDVLQKPNDDYLDTKRNFHGYF